MAGTFSNFMRGYEGARRQRADDEDRQWQRGEREYQQQQRAIIDPLRQRHLEAQVGSTERESQWALEDRPINQQMLEDRAAGARIARQTGEYNYGLLPELTRQQNELHADRMATGRQSRQVQAQQEARRRQLEELKLDEAGYQAQKRNLFRTLGPELREFQHTGDPSRLGPAWRDAFGLEGEGGVVKIGENEYGIQTPDGVQSLGTQEDVFRFGTSLLMDDNTLMGVLTGMNQNGGNDPAAVKTLKHLEERFPRREGESKEDQSARIYALHNQAKTRSEQERFEGLMQRIMGDNPMTTPDKAAEQARAIMAQSFRTEPTAGARGGTIARTGKTRDDPIPEWEIDEKPAPGTWIVDRSGRVGQVR